MRRLVTFALVLGVAAGLPAAAQTVERIRVVSAGGPLTNTFPRATVVALTPPPDYTRAEAGDTQGAWVGPRYQATGNGAIGGRTSMAWNLRFGEGGDTAAAANALLAHRWPLDVRGGLSVPHVVRGRVVGAIFGHYVLTRAPGDGSARYEATVAFPLAPRVLALIRFEAVDPESEVSGEAGRYVVNGSVPVSTWNRGQAFWSITGVRVEGSLPPTRISAQAAPGVKTVRGTVADAFRHPVAGARVQLQRNVGGGWARIASTRTDAAGRYRIRGVAHGRYRAVATLAGVSVQSRPVLAGA